MVVAGCEWINGMFISFVDSISWYVNVMVCMVCEYGCGSMLVWVWYIGEYVMWM